GRGDRRAPPDPAVRRRPGGDRRGRDAGRVLRHVDDADGGELQPRPGGAARAQGPQWCNQGASRDGAAAARGQYPAAVVARLRMSGLTPELAARFARLTLSHLGRQWPYKMDHVLTGPED